MKIYDIKYPIIILICFETIIISIKNLVKKLQPNMPCAKANLLKSLIKMLNDTFI